MNFYNTYISNNAIQNAYNTLKTGFVSAGKQAEEFESLISNKGFKNPISVNSGTSALHLALLSAGIKNNDEVILTPLTFVASALSILYCGAKPIFADINPFTTSIDSESILKKITPKTKAIMPVFWGGECGNLDEIKKIANDFNLKIIADCAHAIGTTYKNQNISNYFDFSCFSMQSIKFLVGVDAGFVCTTLDEKVNQLKKLRWFGIDRDNDLPDILGERVYDLTEIGYKYHMNDLTASIAKGNLLDFDKRLERVQNIANRYYTELKSLNNNGLKLIEGDKNCKSSYWVYPILVENRLSFINALKDKKIPTSVVHLGIDKNTIFGGIDNTLVGQRYFDENQIHIPIHAELTDDDIELIINTIKKGW